MRYLSVVRVVLAMSLCALAGCGPAVTTAPKVVALPEIHCLWDVPFPTIAGPAGTSLQIVALGDAGEGPEERGSHLATTINAVKKLGTADAILLLGDNVYRCGVRDTEDDEWERVIAPLFAIGRPIYPVLGNHDWGRKATSGCTFSNPDAQIQQTGRPGFELWRFPAPMYVMNTAVAEFILFDSSPIAYAWPEERADPLCQLRAALARPKTTPWRVVVAHHPLYSCGDHGDEASTLMMRAALEELLAGSDVDVYLAGHDHDLEISSEPRRPVHVVSGSASKIRRRGAMCPEGDTFRIEGGFAMLDIDEASFTVHVYCNDAEAPCMERRIDASDPPGNLGR